jgi:hypothetical protein
MSNFQQAMAESFYRTSDWEVSTKGNKWRKWGGITLTLFWDHRHQGYSWCIADEDGVRYSDGTFISELAALEDLGIVLGVDQ